MMTLEERMSRMEGGFEHVATKADLAELKVEIANLRTQQAEFEARLMRWLFGMVGTVTAAVIANIVIDLLTA